MNMRKRNPSAVYLDVCALCRPYDEQNSLRIEAETVAVNIVVALIKSGDYICYYSPVHLFELMRSSDETERTEILLLLHEYGKSARDLLGNVYPEVERQAFRFESAGMKIIDAMHVAHAEAVNAAFISCDDSLLKKCRKCDMTVWFGTPVDFCTKEQLL